MASPAEVANELSAQANIYARSDRNVERACRDAARMIRQYLAGEHVDGRTWGGLHTRLLDLTATFRSEANACIAYSLDRGLQTLYELRAGVGS